MNAAQNRVFIKIIDLRGSAEHLEPKLCSAGPNQAVELQRAMGSVLHATALRVW